MSLKLIFTGIGIVVVALYVASSCEECSTGARTFLRELFRALR